MPDQQSINVLDVAVWWADGAVNWPQLTFLVDQMPQWPAYEKRPCDSGVLSAEQEAAIGRCRPQNKGWNIYWREVDGFASFFTWGGKPDDGFGGWRRTIALTDGTEEVVVGGWHTSGDVAVAAGFPPVLDIAVRTDYAEIRGEKRLTGGIGMFMTEARFCREVEEHLPDCEVTRSAYGVLTVKWRGQPSKDEFMDAETVRCNALRGELKAKYPGGTFFARDDWYFKATDDERDALSCRPYSALGPVSGGVQR